MRQRATPGAAGVGPISIIAEAPCHAPRSDADAGPALRDQSTPPGSVELDNPVWKDLERRPGGLRRFRSAHPIMASNYSRVSTRLRGCCCSWQGPANRRRQIAPKRSRRCSHQLHMRPSIKLRPAWETRREPRSVRRGVGAKSKPMESRNLSGIEGRLATSPLPRQRGARVRAATVRPSWALVRVGLGLNRPPTRRPRERGDPGGAHVGVPWIPAFAGMTSMRHFNCNLLWNIAAVAPRLHAAVRISGVVADADAQISTLDCPRPMSITPSRASAGAASSGTATGRRVG